MELRCPNGIKFGEITSDFIEVKCRSKRCGAGPETIVLHRFSHEGELIRTLRFRDAAEFRKKVKHEAPVRSA
jgi:hypothetical protein